MPDDPSHHLPRRLSDKLLAAFDQACEQHQVEVAELVLKAIEIILTQEAAPAERERRSHLGPVVEAFSRLKTLRESRNEFGPPFLSKIPYLDRLFKNVGVGRDTTHVMIMVTPRIIINSEEEIVQTEGGLRGP